MAVQLARPAQVIVRRNGAGTTGRGDRRAVRSAVGTILRSLLIGLAVGVTLTLGHPGGVVGIAAVGVLAIGAALTSWDT